MLLDLIKPIMIKPDQIQGAREIAQGSFGTIYKAYFNKRAVAVKRINKDRSKPLATKMREAYLVRKSFLRSRINMVEDFQHGCGAC
jgi:serine/threonine protein kinase